GPKLTRAFEEIKGLFDPKGLLNPGKIVRPSKQDDRSLFRFKPGYRIQKIDTVLDWSEWGGFDKAVEMCNNNGHCRKFDAGTMCPSYRVTRDEQHLTRGRANTLRLALSGQLGPDAFTGEAMHEAMDLCVSCKGCKRECPTGVDMARMKIEYLAHYKAKHGHSLRDRAIAYLPRYAPWASRFAPLANTVTSLGKSFLGFTRGRELPAWRGDYFEDRAREAHGNGREVVLFVDTFNRWFEPENVRAAVRVLEAAGCSVHTARAHAAGRPLCCGRTFLTAGMVDEARTEARRTLDALRPHLERGAPVIGLEPSCLFSFRDEYAVLFDDALTQTLAENSFLLEEYL